MWSGNHTAQAASGLPAVYGCSGSHSLACCGYCWFGGNYSISFLILSVPGSVFPCLAEAGCISRGSMSQCQALGAAEHLPVPVPCGASSRAELFCSSSLSPKAQLPWLFVCDLFTPSSPSWSRQALAEAEDQLCTCSHSSSWSLPSAVPGRSSHSLVPASVLAQFWQQTAAGVCNARD